MTQLTKLLCYLALALSSCTVWAQVDADPMPGDPKLVIFQFDENNSYRVFSKPLATTHIQLDNDERVKVLALGDTTGWITALKDNNVFVKPRYPNISTSGTLITNKRTYQFVFRSTTESGRWYQRVTFNNPTDMLIEVTDDARRQLANAVGTPKTDEGAPSTEPRGSASVSPDLLNFNYEITGDDLVKPVNVFDDGFATYIQIRRPDDVPAVFRLIDKDIELVEYVQKNNTIVIPRVLEAGLLKLGNKEAKFYNLKRVKKSLFGGYSFEGVK